MSILLKVEAALAEIRPYLQKDGGDIQLISVVDGVVKIKFLGFCSNCNKSTMTLSSITALIREKVPEIREVVE